ncbi:hypothetical protein [Winogradskyella sp. 4-2091]|uniref:hypothetical protein n=1 Tax=Winogradskyella sp. 4-2091 TaxID=3381659 RepID=UPI003892BB74
MEEYFNTLNFDKTIGLIGFVLTFLSLLYAFFESKRNKTKKIIKLNHGQTFSIFKNNPSLKTDELKLVWNNKEVGNLFLLDIYLKNSGNTSLKKEDFLKPIEISFEEDIEILKTKIFSSSEYTQLEWKSNKNGIKIELSRLEKKKLLKAEIIYTNESISPVNIDVAILDGNIETVELKTQGRENTDREMDAKLYSITEYYVRVFIYLILPFFVLAGGNRILENYGYFTSTMTKIMIAAPIGILSLYSIFKYYGESMSFRAVESWIEYEQNK